MRTSRSMRAYAIAIWLTVATLCLRWPGAPTTRGLFRTLGYALRGARTFARGRSLV
jgi:hypothetical protein